MFYRAVAWQFVPARLWPLRPNSPGQKHGQSHGTQQAADQDNTLSHGHASFFAIHYWLLAIGYWLLVIGYWLLATCYLPFTSIASPPFLTGHLRLRFLSGSKSSRIAYANPPPILSPVVRILVGLFRELHKMCSKRLSAVCKFHADAPRHVFPVYTIHHPVIAHL